MLLLLLQSNFLPLLKVAHSAQIPSFRFTKSRRNVVRSLHARRAASAQVLELLGSCCWLLLLLAAVLVPSSAVAAAVRTNTPSPLRVYDPNKPESRLSEWLLYSAYRNRNLVKMKLLRPLFSRVLLSGWFSWRRRLVLGTHRRNAPENSMTDWVSLLRRSR